MSADIPDYIVHLTASCLKSNHGVHPNQRVSFPLTGILFECDGRRCVVPAAAKRFDTDALSITGIFGVERIFSTYREKLSNTYSISLAPISMARSSECEEQGWGLLAAQVFKNEYPGRQDGENGIVRATPIRHPTFSVSKGQCPSSYSVGAYHVVGVTTDSKIPTAVVVPATLSCVDQQGNGVYVLDADSERIEFGGAPILGAGGQLIAMGLFSGTTTSGAKALVGISLHELASTFGWIIQGCM